MPERPSEQLLKAIAVTAELTGTVMSEPAARVLAADLARYPEQQVMGALTRCRRELKGRLTVAEVLTRLDDGRPGPEEAWALIPRSEAETVVWTDEMSAAYAVCAPLLDEGDAIAARMAFKEAYQREVQQARDAGAQVRWVATLGHDVEGRERVLQLAVEKGRLQPGYVAGLLPYRQTAAEVAGLLEHQKGEQGVEAPAEQQQPQRFSLRAELRRIRNEKRQESAG